MIGLRTCVGCMGRSPQRAMVRMVRADAALRVDPGRRAPGRGAYLHRDESCLRRFEGARRPIRSLRWSPGPNERARVAAVVRALDGPAR